MASWEDVRRLALALPGTDEAMKRDQPSWQVRDVAFAWERPLRRGDREALGKDAPDGPVLCARVPDVDVKDALIAEEPDVYFTTPHFRGYPAVLVRLDAIDLDELDELLTEAWLSRAPKKLAKAFVAEQEAAPKGKKAKAGKSEK